MAHLPPISLLGCEYDDFLFAPIGAEKNGMVLSVVSALARLGLDPWLETANLATLPRNVAAERLSAFIGAVPDWSSAPLDTGTIARNLIARLPHQRGSSTVLAKISLGLDLPAALQSQQVLYVAFVLIIFLGSLGFTGSQRSAEQVNNIHGPTTSGIAAQPQSLTGGPER